MSETEARRALSGILDYLLIREGDRIMLGIDMGRVPLPVYQASLTREALRERERRWCQFIFNELRERLGPDGTLLVPTFTYGCGKPGSVYDAGSTPSENGPFTEFVRKENGTIRSLHPIFSLTGCGKDAGNLLENCGRSAFGALSPFARFSGYGIKFLCLGAELRECITYVHHLEQSYGCPHRFNKSFDVKVKSGGQTISGDWYAYVGFRGLGYTSNIHSLQRALDGEGCLGKVHWKGFPNQVVNITDVDRIGYQLLAIDSGAFLTRQMHFSFEERTPPPLEGKDVCALIISAREVSKSLND